MTMLPRLRRTMLAGTVAMTGVLGAATLAAAQDSPEFEPDYYESALTGFEIEISGSDFVIDDVIYQEYDDGENEQVYIESEYASAQVSFFDDSDAPEDTIELWLSDLGEGMDSLDVVETGVDGDVTWTYAEGVYEDLDFVYYIQITEDVDGNVDVLESVLTLEGGLVDSIDAAQQDISVDGDEFMDDVDLDELEAFLDGGTFRGGDDTDDDSTPSDTGRDRNEDDDSSTSRDRERLPAGDDDADNQDSTDAPTNDDSPDDTGDDENDNSGT